MPALAAAIARAAAAAAALAMAAAPAAAAGKLSGSGRDIPRHAAASGGRLMASASRSLSGTVGEAMNGYYSGGTMRLQSGLRAIASQPGSVAAITAVSKSTGELELSWTAPGLDGLLGDVVSGWYRIDYSSEAGHAFSPNVYRTEFATTVVPGAYQAVTLTGLEPNTTYYTKIYLADARKYFAEDSTRSEESTLTNMPVNPVFAGVHSTSVTISWTLPAGAAAKYDIGASTTNFGLLFPGGVVITSETATGVVVSLSLFNLQPITTYYFKVASLNWQSARTYASVIATVTAPATGPLSVYDLAMSSDPLARTVYLSWANQVFQGQSGILVVISTNQAGIPVSDGRAYAAGEVLADASIVKSTSSWTDFSDAGLGLDSTYYYHLYASQLGPYYSVSVSTRIFLDLAPMAPSNVTAFQTQDKSKVVLNWSPVTSNIDGTVFPSTENPRSVDLSYYEVQRATSIALSSWVTLTTLPATSLLYSDAVPDPAGSYFYRVLARDPYKPVELGSGVGSDGALYAVGSDHITSLRIPAGLAQQLRAGFNSYGSDLIVRVREEVPNTAERVLRSVAFEAVTSPAGQAAPGFRFTGDGSAVDIRYEVVGGQVVPTAVGSLGLAGAPVAASDAARRLAMYWHNGSKYVKLYGKVDTARQTVAVQTNELGAYQVRALVRETDLTFDAASGLSNRAITPNNDGFNDNAVFTFDNPRDAGVSGRVFDPSGAFVADMLPGPLANQLRWDGKANGRPVSGGVYIYQIRGEGKVFNGTLVVIR